MKCKLNIDTLVNIVIQKSRCSKMTINVFLISGWRVFLDCWPHPIETKIPYQHTYMYIVNDDCRINLLNTCDEPINHCGHNRPERWSSEDFITVLSSTVTDQGPVVIITFCLDTGIFSSWYNCLCCIYGIKYNEREHLIGFLLVKDKQVNTKTIIRDYRSDIMT